MNARRVYLDHNATTPLAAEARDAFVAALEEFGNPSSIHGYGRAARAGVEAARGDVAGLVGADPAEIVFTGGGTESNNTVLKMVREAGRVRGLAADRDEVVVSAIEHPCVLAAAGFLAERGIKLRVVGVDARARLRLDELESAVTDRTALVSVMLANNETGTLQDVAAVVGIARRRGALVHSDAVQAAGKVAVDVRQLGVDYLSLSAHKFYGPKGIGALYVRKGAPFLPLLHGGHQEDGRRSGTLNGPAIVACGVAARVAARELGPDSRRLAALRDRLRAGILAAVPDLHGNGDPDHALPNTLNISFRGAEGEAILLYLDLEGIAVSTGSACASGSLEPSHVLLATGLGAELAHGSVRFSLGRGTTDGDIDYTLDRLPGIISRIRGMSTIYGGGAHGAGI